MPFIYLYICISKRKTFQRLFIKKVEFPEKNNSWELTLNTNYKNHLSAVDVLVIIKNKIFFNSLNS